jgi:ectoine hydroxylase-related dioxygenase (phytanoyl-CoA dioxygenase family)
MLPDAPVLTTAESLPGDLIQAYRRDGFVKVPAIITPEEAARYSQDALALAERMRPYYDGPIFTQLVNAWRESDAIRALTMHPNVAAVAEKLAGMPLRLWHDHLLIKQPHNKAPTEFHQDQPFWPHGNSRMALSAWIALVDVPVERGCMTFIPRTHERHDLRPQDLSNSGDLMSLWDGLAFQPRVTLPLRAGDCTFHNGYCAHMAGSNDTDVPRVAHIIIYMDAAATYNGAAHVVTDPLGLQPGDPLAGEMFPRVS